MVSYQLDDDRAQSEYGDKVGYRHEAVERVSKVPRVGQGHRSAYDRKEYEYDLVADACLGAEEVLEAAGAV